MEMDVYFTATPKRIESNKGYLENNVDVVLEIINIIPSARITTDILVNKKDLEKLLKNLKTKRDGLLSITRNKINKKRLKNIKEGIEALQLILDNFDFNKNFLYIYYE